jgi:hypothetical protein
MRSPVSPVDVTRYHLDEVAEIARRTGGPRPSADAFLSVGLLLLLGLTSLGPPAAR